ncbi:MAG TPA: lipoate--protein ligase family protein [Verrucomicrobiae bacterium]|nr:lipoate--protein ligase family protein [Verrucomicrobiae bacterium]
MKLLDLTLFTPAQNLAFDEALLDWCENGAAEEVLRFWESPRYFIVVGYANKVAAEVNVAVSETKGIPIYRRCSGGGTVVQGPGCLNYALFLEIAEDGSLHSISSANRFIMERNRGAIMSLFPNAEISARGHTDLCLGDLKFSGNSQRRRKHSLLFHGTFLLNFNLALVSEVLRMPSKQPDYRKNRVHAEFLTNLNLPAEKVKSALQEAWGADSPLKHPPLGNAAALARDKYATPGWNQKF